MTDDKTLNDMFTRLDHIIDKINELNTKVAVVITRLDNTDSQINYYKSKLDEHKIENKESFKDLDKLIEHIDDKLNRTIEKNQEEHEKMNIERNRVVTLLGVGGIVIVGILKLLGLL